MADLKDIMGLQSSGGGQGGFRGRVASPPPPPTEKKRKRLAPMKRELNALHQSIESTMPSLMPTILPKIPKKEAYKEKRKIGVKVEEWVNVPFKSSARTDNAVFRHWIKSSDVTDDYKFAKFNKAVRMHEYTEEQYQTHFKSDKWTKEDTDRLYSLCKQFDLRFLVVFDKWPADGRTVEDLKERFYSIQRKLIELNKRPGEDLSANALVKHPYNAEQDRERKRQNEALFQRSQTQVHEEETLMQEWFRLENAYKKHVKEATRVLRQINRIKRQTEGTGAHTKSSKLLPTPALPGHKQNKFHPFVMKALDQLNIEPTSNSPIVANALIELRNDLVLLFEMQNLCTAMAYEQEILKEQHAQTLQRLGRPYVNPIVHLPKPEPTTQQKLAGTATAPAKATTTSTQTETEKMDVDQQPATVKSSDWVSDAMNVT